MKSGKYTFCLVLGLLLSLAAFGQNQSEQEVNYYVIAAEQAEGMEIEFGLDYAQVFKVDTMYQRVLPLYYSNMKELQDKGYSNTNIYEEISDNWNDYIDRQLEQIFTPEQWKKFMKSSYGKEKVRRDKRIAKRAENNKDIK